MHFVNSAQSQDSCRGLFSPLRTLFQNDLPPLRTPLPCSLAVPHPEYNAGNGRRSSIPAAPSDKETSCAPWLWLPAFSACSIVLLRRLPDHHPAAPRLGPLPPHPHLLHRSPGSRGCFFARRLRNPRKRETASQLLRPAVADLSARGLGRRDGSGLRAHLLRPGQSLQRRRRSTPASAPTSTSAAPRIFTLGLGDVTPHSPLAARPHHPRMRAPGFGFLAVVMGYFPVLYGAFSRREVSISLLDARAGSPPTAAELMRRHSYQGADTGALRAAGRVGTLVRRVARKPHLLSAALLFPFAAQQPELAQRAHRDPRHFGAADRRRSRTRSPPGPAHLRHGPPRARRPLADLLARPRRNTPRPPAARALRPSFINCSAQSGVSVCRDDHSRERLREMRALYEGYAEALSRLSAHASAAVDRRPAAQGQLANRSPAPRANRGDGLRRPHRTSARFRCAGPRFNARRLRLHRPFARFLKRRYAAPPTPNSARPRTPGAFAVTDPSKAWAASA